MAGNAASRIRPIKKSLSKSPKVGATGETTAYDPSRGKTGVVHPLRIKPINTRVYGKKTTKEDPSDYYGSGFGGLI